MRVKHGKRANKTKSAMVDDEQKDKTHSTVSTIRMSSPGTINKVTQKTNTHVTRSHEMSLKSFFVTFEILAQ